MFLKESVLYATSHFIKTCQGFSYQRETQNKRFEGKEQHKPALKKNNNFFFYSFAYREMV